MTTFKTAKLSAVTFMLASAATLYASSVSAELQVPESDVMPANILVDYKGDACPGTCVDLASSGLDASGGAVLFDSVNNRALKPGSDTGNADNVESFNVTSSSDEPDGADTPIEVTGLNGFFDFYWGSVDSFNVVDFFVGGFDGTNIFSYSGTDLVNEFNLGGVEQHFGTDAYVTFTGAGDFSFDSVRLSSEAGVAFEVARSVPEPTTLGMIGLGLLGVGALTRRRRIG